MAFAGNGAMTPQPAMPNPKVLTDWPSVRLARASIPIAAAGRGRNGAAPQPFLCRDAGVPARSRPRCEASERRWADAAGEIPVAEVRGRLRQGQLARQAGARER